MSFKLDSFLKTFIMCFVMMMGFFFIYAILFGVPNTIGATLMLILLSVLSFFGYLMWCKEVDHESEA